MPDPKPPAHLSPASAKWWRSVVEEYELAQHHLVLLEAACSTLDRLTAARDVINRDGPTYIDRFGAPRARPEVAIERDSRTSLARLIRELDLDIPPPEPPRPPALRSNRKG